MGLVGWLSGTKKGRNFMNKVVCWGASVVITGALFKIEHLNGSAIMLFFGLGTEAVIFFFYGLLPEHEEVDWSLVYPELAGIHEEGHEHHDGKAEKKGTITEQLDSLLEEAKIGPELIESLGHGLQNLSENTAKMTDITGASIATNEYVTNIKSAAKNMGELSTNSSKASESLEGVASADVGGATKEYVNNVKEASKNIGDLAEHTSKASESLEAIPGTNIGSVTRDYAEKVKAATDSIGELNTSSSKAADSLNELSSHNSTGYIKQLEKMSENVTELNKAYEMELQVTGQQVKASEQLQENIAKLVENLSESVEDTQRYRTEMAALVKNIESLNTVYGNMLTAMNVRK
jgi:gliding motility-associated protein GldL